MHGIKLHIWHLSPKKLKQWFEIILLSIMSCKFKTHYQKWQSSRWNKIYIDRCRSWAVWQPWKILSSIRNFQILLMKCTRGLTHSNFSKSSTFWKDMWSHIYRWITYTVFIFSLLYKCEKLKYLVRIFPCINIVLDQRLCPCKWNVSYKENCNRFHQSWHLFYIMEAL